MKTKSTIFKMLAVFVLGLFLALPAAHAQYCGGGPTSTFDSNVTDVTLVGESQTISHTGCPGVTGLQLLLEKVADVTPGNDYDVSVTWGTCGGPYPNAATVWIDWNANEVFEASEVIGTWTGSPTATMVYNFTVPDDAVTGTTRMRVMQREGGSLPLDPCGTYSWGSNMDFSIEVLVAGGPGSATATYSLGDIPTDYNQPSTCPQTMIVTIPEGDNVIITGVDVSYTMTAAGGAWMSEQRSRISILNPGGIAEAAYASGSGTTAGTFSYERLGLNIGEIVTGGGDIIVQMDAYRTWGGSGCNLTYNKVDNGTWTVTIHYDIATEGYVAGVVKDAASDEPIVGAHVMVGDQELTTVAGGEYEFTLSGGEHTIMVHKSGYMILEQVIEILPNETLMLDLMLMESANVPGAVLAELNAPATAVNITWGLPMGQYEIIYDDGIADNVTAWGLGGNLNALRFTPAGYPAKVIAGSVNIFDGTYPPAGDPLVAFQMAVYDASGPAGYPGEELGVVDVTPDDFGWVSFDLSELDITIASGDFYLVMIQGGNFPNCAPIAVDETSPVMRSYSRFVTGGAPWTPAGFNDFMMRAIVEGPGGPSVLSYGDGELIESSRISEGALFMHAPQRAIAEVGMGIFKPIAGTGILDRDVIGYHVYRLVEGDEGDESLWTLVGNPSGTAQVDNSWPTLDDGSYRWAVKARYPLDNLSDPTFSNVLGKNWTSDITINVSLSDPNVSPAGIQVGLTNTAFPQYAYNGTTNDDGVVNFPEVWKGNYDLVVYKFGFDPYLINVDVADNSYNLDVMLLETTYPPTALYVDPETIHATWVAPGVSLDLLEEDWSSGGFTANEWTFDPAQGNWQMDASFGNPAASARFYWSPSVTNYNNALVSKELSGLGMPNVMFSYDIYLSNFSSATLEEMTVEVWNGSSWIQIANYSNAGGNIAWTTHTHDITAHAQGQQFKVRFRAHGANSFNINWWNLDNIMVYGDVADGSNRGVLGYYVFLDDVLAGFTEETSFQYQPEYVNYGQTYTAGVRAVYESGFSDMITYVFTSEFLYPPCNLEGEDVGHAVELTWEAPGTCDPFGGGGGGGGGGTGELYEIKYHNGIPGDAYFQQFNYGYGVVYNVSGYDNVTIEKVDYRHSPWGIFGTWDYKIHVVDWDTHTLLHTTSVLQSTVNDGWELDVPLSSIDGSGLVGIFLEPMGNVASDAYPCLDGDATSTTSSFFGVLPNWSGMASAGVVGNFLMDLWIMADPMEGGERQLVKAPVLEGAEPLVAHETRRDWSVPIILDLATAPDYIPGGEPMNTLRDEVVLNYDGPNNDAIGLTAGGTFHVAARFPAAMVGQYAGYSLQTVEVYINNAPTSSSLKIWGAGTPETPGALLHEQAFTATGLSWNTLTLSSPVALDGNDLWIGYTVTHAAGQFPAGCDAGPANPDGAWISMDGIAWDRLYELAPTLNYNWNIRGSIFPGGGGGGGPVETAGFRIYRDGAMIAEVDSETFSYTDEGEGDFLPAGTYNYTVTAIYEYDDDIVESWHEGPATVTVEPGFGFVEGIVFDAVTFQPIEGVAITAGEFSTTTQANGTYSLVAYEGVYEICFDKIGYALYCVEDFEIVWQETHTLNVELTPQDPNFPFTEDWASGSFNTQGWTFVPAQGNWRISTSVGNPAPSAEFYWSPSVTNYSNALTSVEIDARAALQNVTLSYAIFLSNFSATSAEKITVEIWDGDEWQFVAEYKNDSDIPWTTHHHDVTAHAAGKMTRVRFVANGANSFNINNWDLDNIMLHEVLPPEISVNPVNLTQALVVGTTATQELTVNNIGDGALNFTTQVEYLDKSNEFTIYPVPTGDKVIVSDMDVSAAPGHIPGGEPEAPARNEVVLNYDGPNNDAIGLTAGGTFNVAARFPSSMVGQYAGYVLTSVEVYINDVPSGANLKIWGAGSGTAPGAVLHQQTFTSSASSWVEVQLSNPVLLDGTDIWVGYEVTHGAGQFPAGCDAGPANPNGDWISTDGVVWEHLAGFGLNFNWNIRATLNPGEGLWLSVSPTSGNVAPGGSQILTAEFDATGLEIREYTANININSNDPNNSTVAVPVLLDVLIGINEVDREAVMVYPVPAADVLNVVTSQGIRNVRMFSYTGQVVYEANITGESTLSIDVKSFHTGAYILQFITAEGQSYNKRVLISR
jgi:hypothetical protein